MSGANSHWQNCNRDVSGECTRSVAGAVTDVLQLCTGVQDQGALLKSYFLTGVSDRMLAQKVLSERLPKQEYPWLLMTEHGDDIIAYVNIESDVENETGGHLVIAADMSGRHYNEDDFVISLLRSLQAQLGGMIRGGNDNLV